MPTKTPSCTHMPNYVCVDDKHFCLGKMVQQIRTLLLIYRRCMACAAASAACQAPAAVFHLSMQL